MRCGVWARGGIWCDKVDIRMVECDRNFNWLRRLLNEESSEVGGRNW